MNSGELVVIHINGEPLRVEQGLTILQAARQNGFNIPTLCDFPGLPSRGSCRICIVEIEGRESTPTSCTTLVEEGMFIYTHSPKVQALRVELIQMLLAEHPSGCLFCSEKDRCDECMVTLRKAGVTTGCGSCPKNGQCELQSLAQEYGVERPIYPIRYRKLPVDKRDPFFDRDDNLCILCGRCIRVCEEMHFKSILSNIKRGTHALVGTAFQRTHLESGCTFCGGCVEVCPTGSLSEKYRKWDGLPEQTTATTCPLCSIGCQVDLLVKQGRILGSLPNHHAGSDILCVKGRFGITELVNHPDRLRQPQRRMGKPWQAISWEEAIQCAAEKLAACSPERFEIRISASCTSEDIFVARQFAREVMGTGNFRTSFQASYGNGLGSIAQFLANPGSLEEVERAPAILCCGLEDPYAYPVVESHLRRAKDRGAKIIEMPAESAAFARAARLLQQPAAPVVILAPTFLTHPDSLAILHAVELLKEQYNARVIILPDQINLAGAMRLGLFSSGPAPDLHDLDVLYLIGEPVPAFGPNRPFILYQNLFPPAGDSPADLLLPMTAFTEEHGTYINYAGHLQSVHQAVLPSSEVLSSWEILCRIARQMGVQGFAYTCVEDIWQAARAEFPGFPETLPVADGWFRSEPGETAAQPDVFSEAHSGEPAFMGFPLAQYIGGLRSLYPETTNRDIHEANS